MTKSDYERVIIFKRILKNEENELANLHDDELLKILDMSVLPNSFSAANLESALLVQSLKNKNSMQKKISKIEHFLNCLNKIEKSILLYALLYGFSSFNSSYEYHNYIYSATDIRDPKLISPKKITFGFFDSMFGFFYNLLKKLEMNKGLPRL